VGKVIDKLSKENMLENTLIFFLSDNGGAHNNQSSVYPLKGWKGNEFEGGHRVPFFVTWKGKLPAGKTNTKLVSSLDIFATAQAVSGAKTNLDKPLDGVNLIPFIKGEQAGNPHEVLFWRKDQDAAVRLGDYKLISLKNYGSVLYNINQNVEETKDISKENKVKANELMLALSNWESKMVKPLWIEDKDWTQVTFDIHKALMNNKQPKMKQP
jgi:arylsulfatase A-like enzyme